MDRVANKKLELAKPDILRLAQLSASKESVPSAVDRKLVIKQCNSRMNWSDGGHWIGRGPEPDCRGKEISSGSSRVIYSFPTDAAAFKWNAEWEKAIRHAGHLATGVVTVTVALATGGVTGIAVGTIAAILKDELQALLPYPKMSRGWSYVFSISHTYKWAPHPMGKSRYIQEYSSTCFDHNRSQTNRSITRLEFDFQTFPEPLAIKLASTPGRTHNVIYSDS